jgi:hypothetical protein
MPDFRLKKATILTIGDSSLKVASSLYAVEEEQVKRIECLVVKAYKSLATYAYDIWLRAYGGRSHLP